MSYIRKKPLKQYKFLTLLFITVFIICDITAFRMVAFFGSEIPLSGLIIPCVFALGDIIAEVYGYRITMKILFCGIICQFLFGIFITIALMLPSPAGNTINSHYDFAFQHIIRTNITSVFSVSSGMLANAFLISKLKVYMNGKRFWIRTLISSGFSEIILCIVAYLILFSGLRSFSEIIKIIYSVWIYKMVISIILNPFISLIGKNIKLIEHSDVYDTRIAYNLQKQDDCLIEFDNDFLKIEKWSSNYKFNQQKISKVSKNDNILKIVL